MCVLCDIRCDVLDEKSPPPCDDQVYRTCDEAELRAAAEDRGIVMTEEQVQAFMAFQDDWDCVDLEAFLNSVDGSVAGFMVCGTCGYEWGDGTCCWEEGDFL